MKVTAPEAHALRPTVLIVDDVESNLVALRALLDNLPCEVASARSGTEALRKLLREDFAVMLLDVQMPEMDGYEVARLARMNPKTREVPIIFLTAAHDSDGMQARGYGSGAVDFLFKPIDSAVLISKVRVFLELHVSRRTLALTNEELVKNNRELRAAYDELRATQAQLVQAAKMASLGELVAGVAHEINNPLAFVMSHLDTVHKSLELFRAQEDAERYWQKALQRLDETELGLVRIRDLVLKLRTFARLDQGERSVMNVAECVDSVITILGHRLKPINVELRLRPPSELECYPSLLNQVLLNLVANAVDAIDGTGQIVIEAGGDGSDFVLSVTDTGHGIPAELRERVLEPFFTTKPVGQGTGLGLSIAHSIVHKHGGRLVLSDAPGGGTLARIAIPMAQPAS
jgi:two-component system, NtrC family, sensor kinase